MEIYQADWYLLSGKHLLSFAYTILITFLVAWGRLLEQATLFTKKQGRAVSAVWTGGLNMRGGQSAALSLLQTPYPWPSSACVCDSPTQPSGTSVHLSNDQPNLLFNTCCPTTKIMFNTFIRTIICPNSTILIRYCLYVCT